MGSSRLAYLVISLLAVLICFIVYYPGLSGDFEFDDQPNILENKRIVMEKLDLSNLRNAALSGESSSIRRPIPMLSFSLNQYFTGWDPFYFKLTNLIIHILNGISLLVLTNLILISYRERVNKDLSLVHLRWISLVVVAAWMIHPLNLTSVLYIVQRMTILSALFAIWALVLYVWGRLKQLEGKEGRWLILSGIIIFGSLSTLCKENGVLTLLFISVIEITLFRFATTNKRDKIFLRLIYGFLLVAPLILLLVYFALKPDSLIAAYRYREFTLIERLLTEARVLWMYILWTVIPNISQMGLYHDDLMLSKSLFDPPVTAIAILGLAGLILIATFRLKSAPLLSLGLLWFFVGHSMESTYIALEIMHEHRNYLPGYGLLLVVFFGLLHPNVLKGTLKLRSVLACLFIGVLGFSTAVRADNWGNLFQHAALEVQHHPNSMRANYQMGRLYFKLHDTFPSPEFYQQAHHYLERSTKLNVREINGLVGTIMLDSIANKTPNAATSDELIKRITNYPLTPSTVRLLKNLYDCQLKANCKLSHETAIRIFQSAVENIHNTGEYKAVMLAMVGGYYSDIVKDNGKAIHFFKEALAQNEKEIQLYLNLARLHIITGEFTAAERYLNLAHKYDSLRLYEKAIRNERQLLNAYLAGSVPYK